MVKIIPRHLISHLERGSEQVVPAQPIANPIPVVNPVPIFNAPVVVVDGVVGAVTESPPGTTDGDYQYDYLSGTLTFNVARNPNDVIEVSSKDCQYYIYEPCWLQPETEQNILKRKTQTV